MRVSVVGLGLIGGSMALDLKSNGLASAVYGMDINKQHCQDAIKLKLVDKIVTLDEAIELGDLIILAIPVQHSMELLPGVLDKVNSQIVIDVGSTKHEISKKVKNHTKRKNYLATHPMAGTEFSGPKAAKKNLFRNKVAIYCDVHLSSRKAIGLTTEMYDCLGMPIVKMTSREHDLHTAYVSHISHISSFALALTVLKKEKDAENIFHLASGGFDSTVRLAKSSAAMWTPIFTQNANNVLSVLDTYISELQQFRQAIEKQDAEALNKAIKEANQIRKILKG